MRSLLRSSALGFALACSGGPAGQEPRAPALTAPAAPSAGPGAASQAPPPAAPAPAAAQPREAPAPAAARPRAFPPADIAPPSPRSAEPNDGRWVPWGDARGSDGAPLLYTTLIHPHETSRFITLTLVAIDLTTTRLEFLPGVDDVGKLQVPFAPGLVPERERASLIAAFNGGFMPRHGRWGMRVGEITLLPPRDPGCSIALLGSGEVRIRSWPALAPLAGEIRVLRQTPPCLLEQGDVNADLLAGRDKAWAGQTPGVVTRRRSAVGISEDGKILFYAVGVEAPPKLLATGLRAAGAHDAAQLDINWNWTRFLGYGVTSEGKQRVTHSLVEVEHTKRDYVEAASRRDFFYLLRRD